MAQPVADTVFDVYANTFVDGNTIDIKTVAELSALVNYSNTHGKIKIPCRVAAGIMALAPYGTGYSSLGETGVYYVYHV